MAPRIPPTAGLKTCMAKLESSQDLTGEDADAAIDELVDHEVRHVKTRIDEGTLTLSAKSWCRGIYYLTLAKFFQPTAYKMAWAAVKKIQASQNN